MQQQTRTNLFKPFLVVGTICSALLLSLWLALAAQPAAAQTDAAIRLRLVIEHVTTLDCLDKNRFLIGPDCESQADLYARGVTIAGVAFPPTGYIANRNVISPAWTFTHTLPSSHPPVLIRFEIWDDDDNDSHEFVDLTPDPDRGISFTADLSRCLYSKPEALTGNWGDDKRKCGETIESAGTAGDHALVRFHLEAELINRANLVVVQNEAGQAMPNTFVRHYDANGQYQNSFTTTLAGLVTIPDLLNGDQLLALQPLYTRTISDNAHAGWSYRTYLTSMDFDDQGEVIPFVVNRPSVTQPVTLTVQRTSPLVLFNIVVSLGWGAYDFRPEISRETFIRQVKSALMETNRVIFDVTDGQFALGQITVYDDRVYWEEADIQILPANTMRPWANPGGIVRQPYTYTSSNNSTTFFQPGRIRIGRNWDGWQSPLGNLNSRDGYRMLAHEFAHYAFMLFDEYFYIDPRDNHSLVPGECPGSLMSDPYSDHPIEGLDEPELPMLGSRLWHPACTFTEQYQIHGESAWQTLTRIYTDTMTPPRWDFRLPQRNEFPKPGPKQLPYDNLSSSVKIAPLEFGEAQAGDVRVTVRNSLYEPSYTGQVQVFVLRKNTDSVLRFFEHGTVRYDGVINLVGVKPDDIIYIKSWNGEESAAQRYTNSFTNTIVMQPTSWQPIITAQPITDADNQIVGLTVQATQVGSETGQLMAVLVPLNSFITVNNAAPMTPIAPDRYQAELRTADQSALSDGYLWVGFVESGPQEILDHWERQVVIPFAVDGGSPGSHKPSNPPKRVFANNGACQFYAARSLTNTFTPTVILSPFGVPAKPVDQTVISAPCALSIPATAGSLFRQPAWLNISYHQGRAEGYPPGQLNIYRWENLPDSAPRWELVGGIGDEDHLVVGASVDRAGIYIAMSSSPTTIALTPRNAVMDEPVGDVVNVIESPAIVDTNQALAACNGSIWDLSHDLLRYHTATPPYVNTLLQLRAGQTYYAAVNEPCQVTLETSATQAVMVEPTQAITLSTADLPATVYGVVQLDERNVSAGITMTLLLDNKPYTQTKITHFQGQSVFVVDIPADNPETVSQEGGQRNQSVSFQLECAVATETTTWQPGRAQAVNLTLTSSPGCTPDPVSYQIYLPMIDR